MAKNRKIATLIIGALVIGFLLGVFIDNESFYPKYYLTGSFAERQITLAAVDDQGNGVAVPLKVEVKHGTGKVLADIDKLLFWVDTQQSIQVARDVASNITGIDTSEYDLIYTIESNKTGIVGGPSAGAALAVATAAALQNKSMRQDIVMTGTINADGTIGPIGSILEKAKAAKDIGAKLFIVPEGQSIEIKLIPEETCHEEFLFIYCETRYNKQEIDIAKEVGIDIREAITVKDALNYFVE